MQVAAQDLVICRQQRIHIALVCSNQVVISDLIVVVDLELELLVPLKLVVDRERREECRVKAVGDVWRLADFAPLFVFFCLDVQYHIGVTLVGEVQVGQVSALDEHLYFMWCLCSLHANLLLLYFLLRKSDDLFPLTEQRARDPFATL